MPTLHIFADESGTMPVNDNDKPFVAATVAFLGKPPDAICGSDEDEKLVEILKASNAMPFTATVRPFPGYGNNLKSRIEKIKIMARAKCLLNGSVPRYPDKDGINLHNEVWGFAMDQSLAHIVMRNILESSPIDKIRIVFDQKTMTKNRRDFFCQTVHRIGTRLREYLETFEQKCSKNEVAFFRDRIQFSAQSITVHWSDEPNLVQHLFGLKLADRFARKMYQQLGNIAQTGFDSILQSAGFSDFTVDITKLLVRPVNRNMIDAWKSETGLPEPQV